MQADLELRRSNIRQQSIMSHTLQIALQQLLYRPIASFVTIIVLAMTMVLPLGLFWLLTNAPTLLESWHHSPKIILYLKADTSITQGEEFYKQIEKRRDVAKAVYVSSEQGLKDLVQQTKMNVADKLSNNPLPSVIEVLPKGVPSTAQITQLAQDFKSSAWVEEIQFNQKLMEQRYQWLQFAWQGFDYFCGLLVVIVMLIIASHLQLGFQDNYGALFFNGIFLGIAGGLLAWLFFVIGLSYFTNIIQVWMKDMHELDNAVIGRFLLLSAGIGVLGAGLASLLLLINPLLVEELEGFEEEWAAEER